ncbi:hypothetical protein GJQ55_05775 [Venatoribacter cucullus]|uniref:Uncharacterized protein n=1 Tax=Venatoribacter cucullus TaxID=2661630 RepID=A0A9X7UW63_9GAMM|nr:hypothetical protein [Venatoribacter cucullus]QQD24020.1 hypothetical protein GJQ55_05775 [Venatoribacter cucullus]
MGSFLWASWFGLLAGKKKAAIPGQECGVVAGTAELTVTTTPALVWLGRFSAASFMPAKRVTAFMPGNADIG